MRRLIFLTISLVVILTFYGCSIRNTVITQDDVNIQNNSYSVEDIEAFFNMKKTDIIKLLGNDYYEGTLAIDECSVPLNALMYQDSLTFYGLVDDSSMPTRIECADGIEIMGLKNGMTFNSIQKVLGKANVTKTWISNEDRVAFKLEYNLANIKLKILSYNEDGEASYLVVHNN